MKLVTNSAKPGVAQVGFKNVSWPNNAWTLWKRTLLQAGDRVHTQAQPAMEGRGEGVRNVSIVRQGSVSLCCTPAARAR